jgi:2,4-dienoyl-CoA reductase-like NADH-dependent reductase (Old Yellow Enzyme family)
VSTLFQPYRLRSLTLPNRVWLSPMCQYSAADSGPRTGAPGDWHFAHLAGRTVGGAGLIFTEAAAVSPVGRISPFDLGIWNDQQVAAFRRITEFVRGQGAHAGIQLAHAGRKSSTRRPWDGGGPLPESEGGWTAVGPSPLPFDEGYPAPHELTEAEIGEVVAQFAGAAWRALEAGFEVAEVHGAHGYLIHQFLSPHSNHRTDAYGGSFDNRIRLALRVADAVREVWPDELPVFFRVSATDWLTENDQDERTGWTAEDTVALAARLREHGVDLLDVSTGGLAPRTHIPVGPGYQVPFAARVRAETGLPVAAVGLITEAEQAEKIVANGEADAVLIGRELLRNPYWPRQAARTLGAELPTPPQYLRAI